MLELTKALNALVEYKAKTPSMYRDDRLTRCISELGGLCKDIKEKELSPELLQEIREYSKDIFWGVTALINTGQYDTLEAYTQRYPQIYRLVAAE